MGKLLRQRADIILDQTQLQGTGPGGIDQRLWQMFVHLTIPTCQQLKRPLPQPFRRALRRGLPSEPQIGPDQGQ